MSLDSDFYAYIHARPDTKDANGIYYVGKGTGKRAFNFSQRNIYHKRVTAKHGGRDSILIGVISCSNERNAFDLEIGLIKCLQRMGVNLTNLAEPINQGKSPTYKRTEDINKKQSETLKNYLTSNPNELEKRITRCKQLMSDPETKARQKEGIDNANKRPDVRKRRSESAKRLHTLYKQKHLDSQRTEEIRMLRRQNMLGKKAYTNGLVTKFFSEGNQPEGFFLGKIK